MKAKKWLVLLTFGLLLSLLAACSDEKTKKPASNDPKEEEQAKEKVLSFVNPEAIPSMDPSKATDESSFVYLSCN